MDSNDNHVFEVTNLKSIIVELQEKLEYDCRRLNREFSEKLDNVYECIEKLEIGREKKLNKGAFLYIDCTLRFCVQSRFIVTIFNHAWFVIIKKHPKEIKREHESAEALKDFICSIVLGIFAIIFFILNIIQVQRFTSKFLYQQMFIFNQNGMFRAPYLRSFDLIHVRLHLWPCLY